MPFLLWARSRVRLERRSGAQWRSFRPEAAGGCPDHGLVTWLRLGIEQIGKLSLVVREVRQGRG
jgi:hypothetical protein